MISASGLARLVAPLRELIVVHLGILIVAILKEGEKRNR